jgi:hypothetical protein
MKQLFLSLSFSFILFLITNSYGQDPMRAKLEASYMAFTDALKAKDGEKLKNSLSSHSYMSIKNQMASSGGKFPDDLYKMAPMMTMDLKKMKFLKAAENGPTANLIYYGKDPMGDEAFIIIQYLKENNGWKFEGVKEEGSDELIKKMKAKDMSFLNTKDFKPNGIMPATPKEVTAGDYKAMVDVMAYGYKATVKINGVEQGGAEGGSSSSMVMGGIKKGKNTIEITAAPVVGKDESTLKVTVRALINEEEIEVFTMKEEKPAMTIKKEFEVK